MKEKEEEEEEEEKEEKEEKGMFLLSFLFPPLPQSTLFSLKFCEKGLESEMWV